MKRKLNEHLALILKCVIYNKKKKKKDKSHKNISKINLRRYFDMFGHFNADHEESVDHIQYMTM